MILPPVPSFWNFADVINDVAEVASAVVALGTNQTTSASQAAPTFHVPPTDGAYVAHLYTCGVGTSTLMSNAFNDFALIGKWPGAAALWAKACGLNAYSIAINVLQGTVGIADFNDVMPYSDQADLATSELNGVQYAATQDVGSLQTTIISEAISLTHSGLETMAKNAARKGISSLLKDVGRVFSLGTTIAATGNIANTIGTAMATEPWQGSYLVVGNPWPTASPPPSPSPTALSFTLLPPTSFTTSAASYQPTLTASGSGFNGLTSIKLVQSGAVNSGPYIWSKSDGSWSAAVSAGKLTVNSDSSMTLKPVVTQAGDSGGLSTWTVTVSNSSASQAQTFTVNYTPASTLSFSLLPPTSFTTSAASYQPTLTASGSGFNKLTSIMLVQSGAVSSGPYIWSKSDGSWSAAVSAGKLTVNSDGSMTLRPVVTQAGDPGGLSTWTVTVSDGATAQTQTFTVNYTPASTLSFTLLPPTSFTTSAASYQPTLTASGSGFNNLTSIMLVQSGAVSSGPYIWSKSDGSWSAAVSAGKLTVNSDSSMTLRPVVTQAGDPGGLSTWTVTVSDGATAQTQTFTVNYTPASTLSFTLLPPTSFTTSAASYQPTLTASGSGFNNLTSIMLVQSGAASSGPYIWSKSDGSWSAAVSAGKLIVNSDSSMTLRPVVTQAGDPGGLSTWTVTVSDGATAQTQTFTVNYTPASTLSFTLLPPTSFTTYAAPYQPTLTASGSGFNSLTSIMLVQSGAVSSGPYIWSKSDGSWSAAVSAGKLTVNSDGSMTLRPVVTQAGDPGGLSTWTVTVSNGAAAQTQTFTVNYL